MSSKYKVSEQEEEKTYFYTAKCINKFMDLCKVPLEEKWRVELKGSHLPGVQGPNQASLLSNNILMHELSSHLEASLQSITHTYPQKKKEQDWYST